MLIRMGRAITVRWLVVWAVGKVDIELDPLDAGLVPARDMQVIAFQPQLFQLLFQPIGCDTQVEQRPDKHIAADAAEGVQIQCFHGWLCNNLSRAGGGRLEAGGTLILQPPSPRLKTSNS